MTGLDLSGTGVASEAEIIKAADQIFNELRLFKSPKDAAVAFALAHVALIKGCFADEFRTEAFNAVDSHSRCVKEFISGGLS